MGILVTRGLGSDGGGGGSGPSVVSTTGFANRVDVVFSAAVTLQGDCADYTNYSVTGGTVAVTTTSVAAVGATVSVYITEAKDGEVLTLHLPTMSILDGALAPYYGPYDLTFTSVGVDPVIALASSVDGHTLRVVYSEAVVEADALDTANYSIPGLTVVSIVKETDSVYLVTTSLQTPGAAYTLTVSNVRDLASNII